MTVEWEGAERPAAIFRWSKRGELLGSVAILAIAALGVDGWLSSTDDLFLGVISVFLIALALGGSIGLISALRGKSYVALLREGILQKEALSWSFVPWGSIEGVGLVKVSWQTGLGLRTKEPPQAGGLMGVMNAANWRLRRLGRGWDIGIPLWTIARSDELVALVKRCVADPDARASLGKGAI